MRVIILYLTSNHINIYLFKNERNQSLDLTTIFIHSISFYITEITNKIYQKINLFTIKINNLNSFKHQKFIFIQNECNKQTIKSLSN